MQKTLKRIPEKGIIAGVIAGFAEYVVVDVTVLRILFVLFVLATGFFPGVIAYIVAVVIMPIESLVHEAKSENTTSAGQ